MGLIMKKKVYYALSLLLFISLPVFSESNPAAFLNTGVGARAMGLGGAYVSISDDPTAVYWNPAGLAKVKRLSFCAMGQSVPTSKWDTLNAITPSYQFIGITFPLKAFEIINLLGSNNTFGVGYISNNLGGVSYTNINGSGNIARDTFDDNENAYFISYGFSLLDMERINFGGTFKYITQEFTKIEGARAMGYDMDIGVLYQLDRYTNIAAVLQRGVELSWDNGHKDSGAFSTRFGASKKFFIVSPLSILGSADVVQKQNTPLTGYFGAELGFAPDFLGEIFGFEGAYARLGLDGFALENRYDYKDKLNNNLNYTAGLGVKVSYFGFGIHLDYVLGSYRLGGKDRFSLSFYY